MKKITIIGSLIALFIFGGVCGFAIALRIVKNTLNEQRLVQERQREDTKRLKFTPEQIEKTKPLYEQMQKDLTKVKDNAVFGIVDASITLARDLSAMLTPEQQKEFAKLGEERRARFEKSTKP